MTIEPGADIDADDVLLALARHGVKLHHTQSVVSGAQTTLLWGTEDEDTDAYHVAASATITIPTGLGGIYAITYGAVITGLTVATRQFGSINITSAVTGGHLDSYRDRTDASDDRFVVGITVPLLAGDTFNCDVFHTQGGALNVTGHLSCYRVGL